MKELDVSTYITLDIDPYLLSNTGELDIASLRSKSSTMFLQKKEQHSISLYIRENYIQLCPQH